MSGKRSFLLSIVAVLSAATLLLSGCQLETRSATPTPSPGPVEAATPAPQEGSSTPSSEPTKTKEEALPAMARLTAIPENGAPTVGMLLSGDTAYPSREELTTEELTAEAASIADALYQSSVNTLYYPVNPGGVALWKSKVLQTTPGSQKTDPLSILLSACETRGIGVFALLDPYAAANDDAKRSLRSRFSETTVTAPDGLVYYRPDSAQVHLRAVAAAAELSKYPLSGIVLSGVEAGGVSDHQGLYTYLSPLLWDIADATKTTGERQDFETGLLLSDTVTDSPNRQTFVDIALTLSSDFLLLSMHTPADSYTATLEPFVALCSQHGKTLLPVLSTGSLAPEEAVTALSQNAEMGISGGVLDSAAPAFSPHSDFLAAAIPALYTTRPLLGDTLLIPTDFVITRPLDGSTASLSNDYSTYFVMGTSDPAQPLLLDGEPVERISGNGAFGVLLELSVGENEFVFSQGDQERPLTIQRKSADAPAAKISKISTYTSGGSTVLQPFGNQIVTESLPLLLQCTAPANGNVTALLNGQSYTLKQQKTAEDGTPVLYKNEVAIPATDPDGVLSLGKVTYQLDYQGATSEAEAPGTVYLAGKNRKPVARVTQGIGSVLNPSMESGDFMTTLKPGSVFEIVSQTANYFETAFGGFIQKVETEIATDLTGAENPLTAVTFQPADHKGDERLVLSGSVSPSFIVENAENGNFTIRLIDTATATPPAINSRFFSAIQLTQEGGDLLITLTKGENNYFGYNVSYSGSDTILSFYSPPVASTQQYRPLLGTVVVLDPGHGGEDTGALGVAGTTGPSEKDANLYVALLTRRLLEGLGADVRMTRETTEEFTTIYDRVRFTEAQDADFFLSMHHNSVDERVDANTREGVWVYYYNDVSSDLSDVFLKNLSTASGRKPMGRENAWYVVCRNTLAPSLLLEMGFMPNPKEYEEICNSSIMQQVAKAACQSLVEYVSKS